MVVPTSGTERRVRGLAISGGVALGRTCLFRQSRHNPQVANQVSIEGPDHEQERLREALDQVAAGLETLGRVVADRIGPAEAEIFAAQRSILRDPSLGRQMTDTIADGFGAEAAVIRVLDAYESRLQEVDSAYLKERASDLGELKRRLLDVLCQVSPGFLCQAEPHCQRGRRRVVITDELTPAVAMDLEGAGVLGLVTERGGMASHAAILARSLGIPAVSGIPNAQDLVTCGTEVIVDGDAGEVILWPAAETVERLGPALEASARLAPAEPVEALRVLANLSLADEVRHAREMRAEGIGLYRTEMEFLAAGRLLTEEEQAERYGRVLEAMATLPVYFRLLDLGGDKPSPFLEFPREDNPALGLRGARLLLARPDLLRPQARALARLSRRFPVHVMYPMVVDLEQYVRLRRCFDEAVEGLPAGRLHHGVMFEVPSACLQARELLAVADFASVGSNDLVQYLFAVDRSNAHVAADYTPDRGVFWQVLGDLARAAAGAGRPLSLCGEMAADPRYLPRILEAGVRTVSVSPRLIAGVRRAAAEAAAPRLQEEHTHERT